MKRAHLSISLCGDFRFEQELVNESQEHEQVEAHVSERGGPQGTLLEGPRENVMLRPVHPRHGLV